MTSWWDEDIVDTWRLPLFLCLLAFVVTPLITRSIRSANHSAKNSTLPVLDGRPGRPYQ